MNTIVVYEWKWERIDRYLTSKFPYSRNFFHHLIQRWAVLVDRGTKWNFSSVKKSYKLSQWDSIGIESMERFIDWWVLDEAPVRDIDIRHEEDNYLVIYKPKWVLSHPNSVWDIEHKSVVWWVYHYFKWKWLPSMGSFIRAWLVHRLDKDTDGLMVIAKTEEWLQHFKWLFQRKSGAETIEEKELVPLKKRYQATCVVTDAGREFLNKISWSLPHTIIDMVTAKVPHTIPKEWITKIMEIGKEVDWEITLKLEILTWRTHQIRVHLSERGLPIVGDYLYGTEEERKMMLTAVRLEFEGIDGEKKVICNS